MTKGEKLRPGDEVEVVGKRHGEGQGRGVVVFVSRTPAYAIRFRGSGMVHKWYVGSELRKVRRSRSDQSGRQKNRIVLDEIAVAALLLRAGRAKYHVVLRGRSGEVRHVRDFRDRAEAFVFADRARRGLRDPRASISIDVIDIEGRKVCHVALWRGTRRIRLRGTGPC